MDNKWLTIPQFVEQLNTYYLQNHETTKMDFPAIPTARADIPKISALKFHHHPSANTQKASNSEDFPNWISRNNAHPQSGPVAHIVVWSYKNAVFSIF